MIDKIRILRIEEKLTWGILEDLKKIDHQLQLLRKISRRLHRLNEIACNKELSERQEKRKARIKGQAQIIAQSLGFQVYFQGDPRGCALYLIPSQWTVEQANAEYPNGMAIY